jgi:RNA polymerase sigma-70 factor, ECF subfamily
MPGEALIQARATEVAPDAAIIERARAGDASAFELLLEPRFWRLSRLALSITANETDARDALQDACLRAWRKLPGLRDPSRFDAWLWRIVVNSCRSLVRDHRRINVHEIAIQADPGDERPVAVVPGPGETVSDTLLIRSAFAGLDADKRAILILHHVEERPISEIAGVLRIPEGTAKWRLYAARRALERALEAERR